jgi:hypothetical protein
LQPFGKVSRASAANLLQDTRPQGTPALAAAVHGERPSPKAAGFGAGSARFSRSCRRGSKAALSSDLRPTTTSARPAMPGRRGRSRPSAQTVSSSTSASARNPAPPSAATPAGPSQRTLPWRAP